MLYKILDYLKKCPLLENALLMADFLGEEEGSFSIQAVAVEPVLEQYADGGTLKQFVFKVLTREGHHASFEALTRAKLDQIGQFLEADRSGPVLSNGQTAQKFQILKSATMTDRYPGSRCRELVCRLIYYEEKGSDT